MGTGRRGGGKDELWAKISLFPGLRMSDRVHWNSGGNISRRREEGGDKPGVSVCRKNGLDWKVSLPKKKPKAKVLAMWCGENELSKLRGKGRGGGAFCRLYTCPIRPLSLGGSSGRYRRNSRQDNRDRGGVRHSKAGKKGNHHTYVLA